MGSRLKGQTAWISGGASGIGAATKVAIEKFRRRFPGSADIDDDEGDAAT